MKLLIIRHGDPDYSIDSLTEKGWYEAELLSRQLSQMDIAAFYQSPLGRAQDTARVTLKKMNREAQTLLWLREFNASLIDENTGERRGPWDFLPSQWTETNAFYDKELWLNVPVVRNSNVGEEYARVCGGLDELLASHGYVRDGRLYRAENSNKDTIVLFCHFGVECVMLSHLLGVSPMVLWHGLCAAPSSVSTLVTEERRKGIASFRMSAFGETAHLYAFGEEPAFAARFCEIYEDFDDRHD